MSKKYKKKAKPQSNTIATNKKALFNYEVLEECEAGIKLLGHEIKSLRYNKPSFAGSYVTINHNRVLLKDFNIPRYQNDGRPNHLPKRERELLLRKSEIHRIQSKMNEQGITVVPLSLYFKNNFAKAKIALVRGKKQHDKRRIIRDREEKRKVQRIMKQY